MSEARPEASAEISVASRLDVVPNNVVHPGLLEGWGCRSHPDQGGHRMKIHANARTCPNSRRLLVRRVEEKGWSLMAAAEAAGISERSARKWLGRWRAEGDAGLLDRSSAPKRIPHRTPASTVEAIGALRRLRMTAAEIAEILGLARRSLGG